MNIFQRNDTRIFFSPSIQRKKAKGEKDLYNMIGEIKAKSTFRSRFKNIRQPMTLENLRIFIEEVTLWRVEKHPKEGRYHFE